ncbi:hypothetical protein RJ641_020066 [Dillenia turbinata]|uniref:Uncharacterized protein n=1 Tax=Dillenia turbinata TaxID=194707 RepID=A0AAN8UJ25_9MAGN
MDSVISSSFKLSSDSLWSDDGIEVFSRSRRGEDDTEALKWASLEKLPTFKRLGKGLLPGSEGLSSEIDVKKLGFREKKDLVDRLVTVAEEDNEEFLRKLRARFDRIPIWLRWYYWINPFAWTLYGMVAAQFGDILDKLKTGETVEEFLRSYFGFRHDFVGVCAAVLVAMTILFAFIFAFSISTMNFQRR